tara:strand:+ start:142 stop:477 length:336 start_codon:yes stop_codon:yes gene_type:complete
MIITIHHFTGTYPSFNICLHGVEGAEPFLTIKGCRIVEGNNGPFVSYPATKNEKTGKWWGHVYGGDKFNAEVFRLATQQTPRPRQAPSHDAARARQLAPRQTPDEDRDIPF